MATIISSTGTNSVEVKNEHEAKKLQKMLGKYGIQVSIKASGKKAI
jgi:hypothetical protein